MDVSVIIVNYNTSRLVLDCLETIRKHTCGLDYEVIVVDNHSTDDATLRELASCQDICYVQSPVNLGFGRANNLGLEQATGRYVLFLNSDTLLVNNAIRMLYDFAEQYSGQLGALGALLENRSGQPIHSWGRFLHIGSSLRKVTFDPLLKLLHVYRTEELDLSAGWAKVDYITGADLFVRRSVLEECGAFNPAFFMYCEETEMEHRFWKAGYDNVLMTGPRIVHLEGESSARNGESRFLRDTLRQQHSEFIYFRLTEPRWKYLAYRVLLPLARQTLWLNPRVSFRDKVRYMQTLFQSVTGKEAKR